MARLVEFDSVEGPGGVNGKVWVNPDLVEMVHAGAQPTQSIIVFIRPKPRTMGGPPRDEWNGSTVNVAGAPEEIAARLAAP